MGARFSKSAEVVEQTSLRQKETGVRIRCAVADPLSPGLAMTAGQAELLE